MKSHLEVFLGILTFVVAFLLAWGGVIALLKWSWNLVVAGLFHGPTVDWWQAFGVSCLLMFVGGLRRAL